MSQKARVWPHAQVYYGMSFLAELWALRDSPIMCQNLQINAQKIELDAKIIAELMTNSSNSNAVNSAMVADCRLLISQVPQVKVTHCYWETNCCADGLARVGNKELDADIMYYNTPLPVCVTVIFWICMVCTMLGYVLTLMLLRFFFS